MSRLPSTALLDIAFVLDPSASNWQRIADAGEAVDEAYWRRLRIFAIPPETDPVFVVDKLLGVNRGHSLLAYFASREEMPLDPELIVRVLRHPSTINPPEDRDGDQSDGMGSWYLAKLFTRLDGHPEMDETTVQLEWIYYRGLEHSERPPKLLNARLASDPDFFVMLIREAYRPANPETEELDAAAQERANIVAPQAYHILDNWNRVPGSDSAGLIDGDALRKWLRAARAGCAECDRAEMGDYRIGAVFAAAQEQNGEAWPPEPVRDAIEDIATEDLEQGISIGLYNRRGVTTRMPTDGGRLERREAEKYRGDAKAAALLWPRTRALLERIAEQYEADAQREDRQAEQRDW